LILVAILAIAAGVFIGISIGSNDAANCVGADIGSGMMSIKQGIIVTCLSGLAGALIMGRNVTKTIGKGIVPLHTLDPDLALLIGFSAALAAGIWIMTATHLKLPVSSSHSIVGAVAGAGLAAGTQVFWEKLGSIFLSWILTPLGAAILALALYYPSFYLFKLLVPEKKSQLVLKVLIFLTSVYLAFNWGANDVANATGVISGAGITTPVIAILIGAISMAVGVVIWGSKVVETIGFRITRLLPIMTLVAEVASALNVNVYTWLGIPVSTSHSIVGAVFGVGLIHGKRFLNKKLLSEMVLAWAVTPFIAGAISFIFMIIFSFVIL